MSELQLKLKGSAPVLSVNEGFSIEPFNLLESVVVPEDREVAFQLDAEEGDALPLGLSLSADGIISGIPRTGTAKPKPYHLLMIARSSSLAPLMIPLRISVLQSESDDPFAFDFDEKVSSHQALLGDYWKLFTEGMALPDIEAILTRGIASSDIYYLMGKFATILVWNADDMRPAESGELITLKEVSDKYNVYDMGVVLIATPKDLYDDSRGLKDGIQTAKALIREAHKRGWAVELSGYDKLMRAAWIEAQHINALDQNNTIDVKNYDASGYDYALWRQEAARATPELTMGG